VTVAYLPAPVDDELLYSLLGRHRLHCGLEAASAHTAHLFGFRSVVVSLELQGRLGNLANRLHPAFDLDAETLLHRHTLFPYFAAFQPKDLRDLAGLEMIEDAASSAFVRLGVAAFRASGRRQIRFCAECQGQQLASYGECMWLRSHQLPGNLVCPLHSEPLREAGVSFDGTARHGFRPPRPSAHVEAYKPWGREVGELLGEIARRQSELCRRPRFAYPASHWKLHYRTELKRLDLMRSPKKVDQPKLEAGLQAVLGPVLPHLPSACTNVGEGGWPMLMVREHRKAMHPLFHVLMELALERLHTGESSTAWGSPAHREVREPPQLSVADNDRESRFEAEACTRLRHAAKKIRKVAPPCRVTFAELERRTLGAGWLRHRRLRLPRAFALGCELSESTASFRERRVLYWREHLHAAPTWQVLRAAGIRTEHWEEATRLCLDPAVQARA
jgi:hypothetical protein